MAFSIPNFIFTLLACFFIALSAGISSLAGIYLIAANTAPESLASSGYKPSEYRWYVAARIYDDVRTWVYVGLILFVLLLLVSSGLWSLLSLLLRPGKARDVEMGDIAAEATAKVSKLEGARDFEIDVADYQDAKREEEEEKAARQDEAAAEELRLTHQLELEQLQSTLDGVATTTLSESLFAADEVADFDTAMALSKLRIDFELEKKRLRSDWERQTRELKRVYDSEAASAKAALDSVTTEKNALATERDGLLAEKSTLLTEKNQAACRHGNVVKNLNDTTEGLQKEVKQAGLEKVELEKSHQNELASLEKDHESNTAAIQTSLYLVSAERDTLLAEKEKSAVEHEDAAKQLEETIEYLQGVVEHGGVEKEELETSYESKLASLEKVHESTTATMKTSLDQVSAEKDALLAEMTKTAGEHEKAAKQLNDTIDLLQNDIKEADRENRELRKSHKSKLDSLKKEYGKDVDLQLDVCSKNLTKLDDRAERAGKALKDRDDAAEEAAGTKAELEKKIDDLETRLGRKRDTTLWLSERLNRPWLLAEPARSDAGVLRGLGSQATQRAEGRGQRSSSVGAQRAPEASLDDVLEEPLDDFFEESGMTEEHEANGQQQVIETAGLEPADLEGLNDQFVTAMRSACPGLLPLLAHTDEGYGSSTAGNDVDGYSASEHGSQQLHRGSPDLQPLPAVTNEIERFDTAESDVDDDGFSGDGSPQLQRGSLDLQPLPTVSGDTEGASTAESDVDDNDVSGDGSQQLQRSSPDLQPLPAAIDENDGVSAAESNVDDNDVSGNGSQQLQRALAEIRLPPAFAGKVQRPRTAESDVDDHEVVPDKTYKKMGRALDDIPLWPAPTDPFQKPRTRETGRMGYTRSYESQDIRVQLVAYNGFGGRNAQGTMPQGLGSVNGGNQGFHREQSNAQFQGQQVSGRPIGTNDGSNRGPLNLNPGVPPPHAPRGPAAANTGANRGPSNDQTGPQAPSERPRIDDEFVSRFGTDPQGAGAYTYTPRRAARRGRW